MKHSVYFLTFSVSRLAALLQEAGWDVEPPRGSEMLVRFVSDPSEKKVALEFCDPGGDWHERAGQRPKEVETIRPGQYL